MKDKKPVLNENVFGAIKKFTDAFFDGLKSNTVERVIRKASEKGLPPEAIEIMNTIKSDKERLETLLQRIEKL